MKNRLLNRFNVEKQHKQRQVAWKRVPFCLLSVKASLFGCCFIVQLKLKGRQWLKFLTTFAFTVGKTLQLVTSVTFAGPDLRSVYAGSLGMNRLPTFRLPVPGLPMRHWK